MDPDSLRNVQLLLQLLNYCHGSVLGLDDCHAAELCTSAGDQAPRQVAGIDLEPALHGHGHIVSLLSDTVSLHSRTVSLHSPTVSLHSRTVSLHSLLCHEGSGGCRALNKQPVWKLH